MRGSATVAGPLGERSASLEAIKRPPSLFRHESYSQDFSEAASLNSIDSSGNQAPNVLNDDEPALLVAPALVVANICTNLASMTGAIMSWYFSEHTRVWGTGFFEGTLNIGASMAILGILLCRSLPGNAKMGISLFIFLLCLFANIFVIVITSEHLMADIKNRINLKDLFLKTSGLFLTLFGAIASSLCLIWLAIRAIKSTIEVNMNPDIEITISPRDNLAKRASCGMYTAAIQLRSNTLTRRPIGKSTEALHSKSPLPAPRIASHKLIAKNDNDSPTDSVEMSFLMSRRTSFPRLNYMDDSEGIMLNMKGRNGDDPNESNNPLVMSTGLTDTTCLSTSENSRMFLDPRSCNRQSSTNFNN